MSFRDSLIESARLRYVPIEKNPEYVEFIEKIKEKCRQNLMVRRITVSFSQYANDGVYDYQIL